MQKESPCVQRVQVNAIWMRETWKIELKRLRKMCRQEENCEMPDFRKTEELRKTQRKTGKNKIKVKYKKKWIYVLKKTTKVWRLKPRVDENLNAITAGWERPTVEIQVSRTVWKKVQELTISYRVPGLLKDFDSAHRLSRCQTNIR